MGGSEPVENWEEFQISDVARCSFHTILDNKIVLSTRNTWKSAKK